MTIGGRHTVRARDEFRIQLAAAAGGTTSQPKPLPSAAFWRSGKLSTPGEFRVRGVAPGDWHVRSIRWLAVLPFIGLVIGPFFVNRPTPFVLGLPFLLAWIVAWILLTSLIMAVIYWFDPANQEDGN